MCKFMFQWLDKDLIDLMLLIIEKTDEVSNDQKLNEINRFTILFLYLYKL